MENKCVVCGAAIPEGRMVCPNCDLVFRKEPTTATEAARQGEIAYNIGYKKGRNDAKEEIEYWKRRVIEIGSVAVKTVLTELRQTLIINNEENTEYFDYSFTLETINETAKQFGVKIDDGE